MQPKNRLRQLDFLRGIAIILVILRHQVLFDFLKTMGWIGVDLFFVLSGFLVSGLLFKEFKKKGRINPKLFLIRRGFKIYPIFYLTYIIYIIPRILLHKLHFKSMLCDLIFVQNYVLEWGYAYSASWSLAVEEHFYFGLVLFLWLVFNKRMIQFKIYERGFSNFEKLIIFTLILISFIRLFSNLYYTNENVRNFTMTHLRIDSLLFGVLISYWYHFRLELFSRYYIKYQRVLLIFAFLLLVFTPFVEPVSSFFVRTIGFTMLYLSFGIFLTHFLIIKTVNNQINRLFSISIVNFMSKIGFCSYSIYVIHSFVIYCITFLSISNRIVAFILVFLISIFSGFIMTYRIENFFLNYRDSHFPNRIN